MVMILPVREEAVIAKPLNLHVARIVQLVLHFLTNDGAQADSALFQMSPSQGVLSAASFK